jgi:hypothetical protein
MQLMLAHAINLKHNVNKHGGNRMHMQTAHQLLITTELARNSSNEYTDLLNIHAKTTIAQT